MALRRSVWMDLDDSRTAAGAGVGNDGTTGTEETQMAADTARTAADNCGNPRAPRFPLRRSSQKHGRTSGAFVDIATSISPLKSKHQGPNTSISPTQIRRPQE